MMVADKMINLEKLRLEQLNEENSDVKRTMAR